MQANAVRGNLRRRAIDGLDVRLDHLEEAVERFVLKQPRALHGEIGAVELEQEAARVNQLVFLLHLPREREHVSFVGIVVGVEQGRGDDARGGGGHEALDEFPGPGRRGPREQVALLGGLAGVDILDLRNGLRRVRDLRGRAPTRLQEGGVIGKVHQVAGQRPPTLSPEAAQAPRHVGGESHARLLTIVADIDARVQLLADDRPDGGVDLSPELGLIDRLTALLPDQQLSEPWGPRQAPDVRDENAPFTPLHAASVSTMRGRGAPGASFRGGRRARLAASPDPRTADPPGDAPGPGTPIGPFTLPRTTRRPRVFLRSSSVAYAVRSTPKTLVSNWLR